MAVFLILLYLFVVPYLALMCLVIAGMYRPDELPLTRRRPSLSVIIPAHDEEADLPGTLESLSRQRYPGECECEFVIVDDRSSDGTWQVISRFAANDSRFKGVKLTEAGRRYSPKVNAVDAGIRASSGEIIVTSDADCRYPDGWLEALASHFQPGVVMVIGYVETTRRGAVRSPVGTFESLDWLSLMLVARSLTRFGLKFASSANNQAYLREAFLAAGGFGSAGKAPSGDEDLLTQRLGRLTGGRIVFAGEPAARVLTTPASGLVDLLRQRRRWVSRYHHFLHYHPAFMASIVVLGVQSALLSVAVPLAVALPSLIPWVAPLWGVKLGIEVAGMRVGTKQLGREDLSGWPIVAWAVFHPFFIAATVLWSLWRPGDWRTASGRDYRARLLQRRWREALRKARARLRAWSAAACPSRPGRGSRATETDSRLW